jgi:serine/threonine-protein kinase
VVQVYEIGSHSGLPFIALEYVDGGNLSTQLSGIPLPTRQAAQLMERICRAMHAVHQEGIIHRDLKPANILMTSEGTPKISDFGLAKKMEMQSVTQTGSLLGTPSYMAPEQARGEKELTPVSDVYSLGAILYELLTGSPPFQADTHMQTVLQVLETEPQAPSKFNRKIDRDLEAICLKCLNKAPLKRYISADALAVDLLYWLQGRPISARRCGPVSRFVKWVNREPVAASLIGVGALLTVATLVAWYISLGWSFFLMAAGYLLSRVQIPLNICTENEGLRNQLTEIQAHLDLVTTKLWRANLALKKAGLVIEVDSPIGVAGHPLKNKETSP